MLPFKKPKIDIPNPELKSEKTEVKEGGQSQIQKQKLKVILELDQEEASYLYNSLKRGSRLLLGKTPRYHKSIFTKIEKIFKDAGAL